MSVAVAAHSEPATWIHLNPLATPDPTDHDDYVILMGDGPPSPHKVTSPRSRRRRIKARANRGIRPNPTEGEEALIALKTTPWHHRIKRETPIHPRYRRTKLVLVPDETGKLVKDVVRAYPKPAPNRRRAACPAIEVEPFNDFAIVTVMRRPEDELEDALARREMNSTEQALALHQDILEVSGMIPVVDGLPPFTHWELVLQ